MASGEISSVAKVSLAVLMNTRNCFMTRLLASIVIRITSSDRLLRGLMDVLFGENRLAKIELEQVDGIAPADLVAIVLADAGAVEPVGGMIDVFERPVDREQDAIRSDFEDGIDQRLRAEIARSGQEEVGVEVVADFLLCLVLRRRLDPAVAMIDAPHAVGQPFAHGAKDDLEVRMGIEQARS